MKPQPESTGGRLSLIVLQRRKWFSWAPRTPFLENEETRGFGRACVATDLISAKIGDRKGSGNYRYRNTVISGFNASCVVPDTV